MVIAKGGTSGAATLTVTPVADGRDEPDETIRLSAWDGGTRVGNTATLTLVDGGPAAGGITAKPRADVRKVFEEAIRAAGGLEAGGVPAYVDMSRLFDVADPATAVKYGASSSAAGVLAADDASTDPMLAATFLRLTPLTAGTSTVTVAARAADGTAAVTTLTAAACAAPCVQVTVEVGPAGTPVPALPPLAQGLLAALLLAAGTYRRGREGRRDQPRQPRQHRPPRRQPGQRQPRRRQHHQRPVVGEARLPGHPRPRAFRPSH